MELQSVCPCDYRELARRMYLSWQWPKAVNKLGILDIPCPPAPDHLRVWMFKVDNLVHMRLPPNHYLCIQYAWALQFTTSTTTNTTICRPADCLTTFIMAMSPFYQIMEAVWQNHALTPAFMKPYQEFTPHQQATQYFDRLRDIREEAIQFKSAQRKVSFHDSIPRYKWDEGFLNYGKGRGHGVLSQNTETTAASVNSTLETTTGQFADVNEEISELAPATITMLTLEDAEPLKGAAVPDPGTYEPAGNKFTRSHSPKTDGDNGDKPPSSSQETPDCSLDPPMRSVHNTILMHINFTHFGLLSSI